MNQQAKIDIDLDIQNLLKKLIENPNDLKNAVLYIRGDVEYQNASVNIRGDARIVAQTVQHFLVSNEEFKRFILAVVGSWISKNPEDEKQFIAGVEIAKKTFSVN